MQSWNNFLLNETMFSHVRISGFGGVTHVQTLRAPTDKVLTFLTVKLGLWWCSWRWGSVCCPCPRGRGAAGGRTVHWGCSGWCSWPRAGSAPAPETRQSRVWLTDDLKTLHLSLNKLNTTPCKLSLRGQQSLVPRGVQNGFHHFLTFELLFCFNVQTCVFFCRQQKTCWNVFSLQPLVFLLRRWFTTFFNKTMTFYSTHRRCRVSLAAPCVR